MKNQELEFADEKNKKAEKVICLGKEFENEDARREYFREELRKKLPELKKIVGYPIGEDEDIIALSDPPYYTACPNPWINDFIDEWEKEKEKIPGYDKNFKVNEPYASDVSEGKNNPIYNAHSYHTKVPHPAIMRYILHYTQPGDIVFDGFAGTGMTGVAAQMCNKSVAETQVLIEKNENKKKSSNWELGERKSIMVELSPLASIIAHNYNYPVNISRFGEENEIIKSRLELNCSWLFLTIHNDLHIEFEMINEIAESLKNQNDEESFARQIRKFSKYFGKINYVVYSDVLLCPNCNNEIIYWNVAVDKKTGSVKDHFNCESCNSELTKRDCERSMITYFDYQLNKNMQIIKTSPVLINYTYDQRNFEKKPDSIDNIIEGMIAGDRMSEWVPTDEFIMGDKTNELIRLGIRHVHQIYTNRNLYTLAFLWKEIRSFQSIWKGIFLSILQGLSRQQRFRLFSSFPNMILSGTLYIGSMTREWNAVNWFHGKIKNIKRALDIEYRKYGNTAISNASALFTILNSDSVDYIFTDPPFGSNLMYSELNFSQESWLKIKTNTETEAIENKSQSKNFQKYMELMLLSFKEFFRILKPNHWMTVEFSNTSAGVWNGIQTTIQRAGFIIASVAALDKKQGSFNAITTTTAVKQDLVISCYKPCEALEDKFKTESSELSVWEFVREHLKHLPIQIKSSDKRTAVIERSAKILYDRLITFYIMRGSPVPIDASDFQTGLKQRFSERDGMFFTEDQASQYEELYATRKGEQYVLVFDDIYSEADAVLWLRERLEKKPQTYQDIMPDFRKANRVNRKGEYITELKTILDENFIQEKDGKWRVPKMTEEKDRESIRLKALLKEFEKYKADLSNPKIKKLTEVRVEALRAGFKKCWESKEFPTIVSIGDKIPQNILQEDEQLLMYYDIAKDRI